MNSKTGQSGGHEPMPSMTCARMEAILPTLDEYDKYDKYDGGAVATAEVVDALEHLRGCLRCQRERQRYDALDAALRARFGVSAIRLHPTEDIMHHISARAHQPASPTSITPEPSQRFSLSPIPPIHPNHPTRRTWLSGLGAVAIVLVLLGLATVLFSGRLGFGVGSRGPARPSIAATQGIFAAVSMVSPAEGWALAQVTRTPDGKATPDTVTFYHYKSGVWTPVTVKLSAAAAANLRQGGPGGFNGTISMDSVSDGWAVANNFNRGSVLFHYTHGAWQEAGDTTPVGNLAAVQALSATSAWGYSADAYGGKFASIVHFDGTSWVQQPISGISQTSRVVSMQMASDTRGWALVSLSGDYGDSRYAIFQYQGNNTWTTHSQLDAGQLGNISGLAMVSAEDGWAIGQRGIDGPSSVTYGVAVPQMLYHYTHGKWQNVALHLTSSVSYLNLEQIVMRSANDGWLIAQDQNQRPGITASGIQRRTVLLHYDGKTWTEVPTPTTGGDVSVITGMAFAGSSGWACGYVATLPGGQDVQDDTVSVYGLPMLWIYSAGAWSLYQQK